MAWWAGIMTTPFSSAGARDGRADCPNFTERPARTQISCPVRRISTHSDRGSAIAMRPRVARRVRVFVLRQPGAGEPGGAREQNGSMTTDPRRALPAVDVLLAHPALAGCAAAFGRGPVTAAARRTLDAGRRAAATGAPVPGLDELAAQVAAELRRRAGRRTRAVVNATGVVLHTNLGRAPLSEDAVRAVVDAAGYATVEYDLDAGARACRWPGRTPRWRSRPRRRPPRGPPPTAARARGWCAAPPRWR